MSVRYVLGSSLLNCLTNAPAPTPAATVPRPRAILPANPPLSKFGFSFNAIKNFVLEFLILLNAPPALDLLISCANFFGFFLSASSTASTQLTAAPPDCFAPTILQTSPPANAFSFTAVPKPITSCVRNLEKPDKFGSVFKKIPS